MVDMFVQKELATLSECDTSSSFRQFQLNLFSKARPLCRQFDRHKQQTAPKRRSIS